VHGAPTTCPRDHAAPLLSNVLYAVLDGMSAFPRNCLISRGPKSRPSRPCPLAPGLRTGFPVHQAANVAAGRTVSLSPLPVSGVPGVPRQPGAHRRDASSGAWFICTIHKGREERSRGDSSSCTHPRNASSAERTCTSARG
jgi:hypothetical protein